MRLDEIGHGNIGTAFTSLGHAQAQGKELTLEDAYTGAVFKKAGVQIMLYILGCLTIIIHIMLHRRFGLRALGLKAFLAFAIVVTIGFLTARDSEGNYPLSWFGPVFVFIFIGFLIAERMAMTWRKRTGEQWNIDSLEPGIPSIPWRFIPRLKQWVDTPLGCRVVLLWIEPAFAIAFGLFAARFIGEYFGMLFIAAGFAQVITGQIKAQQELTRFLDANDARIRAAAQAHTLEVLFGANPPSVEAMGGFIVGYVPPPSQPGGLSRFFGRFLPGRDADPDEAPPAAPTAAPEASRFTTGLEDSAPAPAAVPAAAVPTPPLPPPPPLPADASATPVAARFMEALDAPPLHMVPQDADPLDVVASGEDWTKGDLSGWAEEQFRRENANE